MATSLAERGRILDELNVVMTEDIVNLWHASGDLDPAAFRALIVEAFPELVDPYAATAAELAMQWYTESAPDLDYVPAPAELPPVEQLASSAQWALGATGDAALGRLAGSAQRAIWGAARETTILNAETEPGARWARHASITACAFCRMLATRGAVYTTEGAGYLVGAQRVEALRNYKGQKVGGEIARGGRLRGTQKFGAKFHDHCHCMVVCVRPGQSYQPPSYVEKWEQEYVDAVRATPGKGEYGAIDLKTVLVHMRENDRPARPARTATSASSTSGGAPVASGGGRKPPVTPPTGGQSVSGGEDREHRRLEKQLDQIMRRRIRQDIPLGDVQRALDDLQAYRAAHGITGVLDARVGPGFDDAEMGVVQRLLGEGRNVTSLPRKKSGAPTPDMAVDAVMAEIKTTGGADLDRFLDRLEDGATAQSPRQFINAMNTKIPRGELLAGVKSLVDDGVLIYARVIAQSYDDAFGRW